MGGTNMVEFHGTNWNSRDKEHTREHDVFGKLGGGFPFIAAGINVSYYSYWAETISIVHRGCLPPPSRFAADPRHGKCMPYVNVGRAKGNRKFAGSASKPRLFEEAEIYEQQQEEDQSTSDSNHSYILIHSNVWSVLIHEIKPLLNISTLSIG